MGDRHKTGKIRILDLGPQMENETGSETIHLISLYQ